MLILGQGVPEFKVAVISEEVDGAFVKWEL